ncbi:nuclear transport factor 2 family protein [Chitinophaga sp.]|uniref:nuclear transport factor 2 family protein n=1 Tax=Chitinophaga sp. TaxID=1869181 RepID=UPI0025BC8A26|nr:nuclear transport factor 2 family protein [Chitinophaga sp.]
MKTQQQDSLAISDVLENRYFKGIYEGDVALLSTIYHPRTLFLGDVKGQPYAKDLQQYLDGVKNRQSPKHSGKPFKGEILSVKTVNSIAIAEVKVVMYDFVYHEFLSFHKIDGKWVLVNKMISDTADAPAEPKPSEVQGAEKAVNLVAYMEILPAFQMEVTAALATMAAKSNQEPGCSQFAVNTRKDAPLSIVVYESYKSDIAFDIHKASAHAKKFFDFVKGKIVNDKIDIVFLTAVNN